MEPIDAYVLAGGRSSRFGTNKAKHAYRGRPLILHVTDSIREVSRSITVVGENSAQYSDLGLRCIGDLVSGKGPVGGLITVLSDMNSPGWCLVVPCDLLGLESTMLQELISHANLTEHACVAFQSGEVPQPFPGVYHTRLLADLTPDSSMKFVIERWGQLIPAPSEWVKIKNINTIEQLSALEET